MAKLEWEWTLGTESVRAALDVPANVETVFLGPRLVSRSAPGGKPDGHAVPLPGVDARVHFNPPTRECVLAINGTLVPPTRVATKTSSSTAVVVGVILVAGVVLLGVFGALAAYGVRKYEANVRSSQENVALSQRYDGPNGLLVAHYPSDFAAQTRGEAALQIRRAGLRDDSAVLIAIKRPISDDPAELSRVVQKPILAAFEAKGSVHTTNQGTGPCLGRPGYTTEGTAVVDDENVLTWSCTFVEGGHAYVFFVSVNKLFDVDMPLMRRIVDATEVGGSAPKMTAPAATATSHTKR